MEIWWNTHFLCNTFWFIIFSQNNHFLTILLVPFEWWKRDPLKGCWCPPTIGDQKFAAWITWKQCFKWKFGETSISYSYVKMWNRLIEGAFYIIIHIDVSRSEQQTDAFLVRWTGKNIQFSHFFFEIPQVFPGIWLGEWWESCLDLNLMHLVGD